MSKKILIIEDDPAIIKLYSAALTRHDFETIQQNSGDISLFTIKSMQPSLILLDIMLPGIENGMDLLTSIKKDEELKEIPVIVITNLDTKKIDALNNGAAEYLIKANTSIEELVSTIQKHIE